jgi:trehalose utilization protein
MSTETLYEWVFHYNHFTNQWAAYHRDDHKAYFNAEKSAYPIFKHKNIKVLIKHLVKSNGNPELLMSFSPTK